MRGRERSEDKSFFFSSRRRHTRWPRDWSSDGALPISGYVASFSAPVTPVCHSRFPSWRLKHITVQRFSFSMGWVIKTRLPHTTGVELQRSGNGARQDRKSVV